MRFSTLTLLLASQAVHVLAHNPAGGAEEHAKKEWKQDDDEELLRKWGFEVRTCLLVSLPMFIWFLFFHDRALSFAS
jgi:hypothetical protein